MNSQLTWRRQRSWLLLSVAVMGGLGGDVRADVLLDQIDIALHNRYDRQFGNAIGGDDVFGDGTCGALQLCDDFVTTERAYIVTQVEVGNLFIFDYYDVEDVRVSIYLDLGGHPSEEPVYSKRVSEMTARSPVAPLGIVNEEFREYDVYFGVHTIVTGLWIPLEPSTGYFICVQVDAGPDDWGYTCVDQDEVVGADSFVRDGPPEEGCQGGWGWTDWRAVGTFTGPGSTAYKVVAVGGPRPSPGDFDRDGAVNARDVLAFLGTWTARDPEADLNGDGAVNTLDFRAFLSAWNEGR